MLLQNLQDRNVAAGEEAHNAEQDQGHVLPQSPIKSAHSWSLPVRYDFDDGWEDQPQRA